MVVMENKEEKVEKFILLEKNFYSIFRMPG
jgi:hypothetical protein